MQNTDETFRAAANDSKLRDNFKRYLKIQIVKAEQLRERGRTNLARVRLEDVIKSATKCGWQDVVASALGHLIVCYKHLYQARGDTNNVQMMLKLCDQGMALDISDEAKSVFHLRKGDCYRIFGEFDCAGKQYQKAIDMAADNPALKAEYQGHKADNLMDKGSYEKALSLLKSADLTLYFESDSLRLFHYRTIQTGFRYKQAKAAYRAKKYLSAVSFGAQGFWFALVLAFRHLKPARLKQFILLLMGKSI